MFLGVAFKHNSSVGVLCLSQVQSRPDDSVLLSLLLRLLLLLLQSSMMDSLAPKSMHKFACNADFLMRHTKAKPR